MEKGTKTVSELYLLAVKMACVAHAVKDYRGKPYFTHYDDVEDILRQYGFGGNETLIIAARLHDIIEDCGWTYNDVKKLFGKDVADLVYLVTDFKGHNRTERKPDQLYIEMREKVLAIVLKVADRLANAKASVLNGDSMGDTYKEEYTHFREMLFLHSGTIALAMWAELDGLMGFESNIKREPCLNPVTELPRFIKFGNKGGDGCVMRRIKGYYHRDAGQWNIDVDIVDGRLITSHFMEHLNNQEVFVATADEWAEGNAGYINGVDPLNPYEESEHNPDNLPF